MVAVHVDIKSSKVGIKIYATTAVIKRYKSIIKKETKKHDKTVLLGKDKLNTVEILISKTLIDSYISHDEFGSVNNMLRKYNKIKEKNKNSSTFCGIHYTKTMETYCVSCKKIMQTKIQVLEKLRKID